MKHLSKLMAEAVKKNISPSKYYASILGGKIGKHSGHGWYAWRGLCPFHADTLAGSFYIHAATGAFKCFSCGAKGGDILAFHMQLKGCSFTDACKQIGA